MTIVTIVKAIIGVYAIKKFQKELRGMKLRGKARRIAWVMRAWLFIKTRRISKSGGWFSCRR